MNEIVKVGNHDVVEIQWRGQKVITTAQLAEVYETDANNVQANFGRNQERFKEGTHYFLLKGQELRGFKDYLTDSQLVAKNAPLLYLWTHRGASRHCKILDTEKAWEQFDNLEEAYFNPQSSYKKLSALEQLKLQNQAILEVDEKVDAVNNDLQEFKRDMPLLALECQKITWAKNQKVVPLLGGKDAPAYKDNGLRSRVYRDVEGQLRREFGVTTYKAIKMSQCDLAIQIIRDYELPMALEEEIRDMNAQIDLFDE